MTHAEKILERAHEFAIAKFEHDHGYKLMENVNQTINAEIYAQIKHMIPIAKVSLEHEAMAYKNGVAGAIFFDIGERNVHDALKGAGIIP